eukprot:2321508-Rhodomonas_salina.3
MGWQQLEASNHESKRWEETKRRQRGREAHSMLVAAAVFHLEMSLLKLDACQNMYLAVQMDVRLGRGVDFLQHRPMTHKTERQRCQRPPRPSQMITPPQPAPTG